MKAFFALPAILLAVGVVTSAALADGPRPSSGSTWPNMRQSDALAAEAIPAPASHWLWQEGYDRGGKWHGHWVLVQ